VLTLNWYFDRRETSPTLVCISPNRIPAKHNGNFWGKTCHAIPSTGIAVRNLVRNINFSTSLYISLSHRKGRQLSMHWSPKKALLTPDWVGFTRGKNTWIHALVERQLYKELYFSEEVKWILFPFMILSLKIVRIMWFRKFLTKCLHKSGSILEFQHLISYVRTF
jgi:hypothetical protein